jgi:hypothetical protein
MRKQAISAQRVTIAVITALTLSLPVTALAQAPQQQAPQPYVRTAASTVKHCKFVDALPSRRCLNFRSDTTFPEGLSDYHGTGGR